MDKKTKSLEKAKKYLSDLRKFSPSSLADRYVDGIYRLSKEGGFQLRELGTSDGELAMYRRRGAKFWD